MMQSINIDEQELRLFWGNSRAYARAVRSGNEKLITTCRAELEGIRINTRQPHLRERVAAILDGALSTDTARLDHAGTISALAL